MPDKADRTDTLAIEGMACDACVAHVKKALAALDGVRSAEVSLPEKQAVVTYDPSRVTLAQMIEAVEEEGYEAPPA